jgi:hypothetical protein
MLRGDSRQIRRNAVADADPSHSLWRVIRAIVVPTAATICGSAAWTAELKRKSGYAIGSQQCGGRGLQHWFGKRGELRGGGQRVSRHYYDLHKLLPTQVGASAMEDPELGADCVAHARSRPDFDLASAAPGSFALTPHDEMIEQLRVDYRAKIGMIFGVPRFETVLESVTALEGA